MRGAASGHSSIGDDALAAIGGRRATTSFSGVVSVGRQPAPATGHAVPRHGRPRRTASPMTPTHALRHRQRQQGVHRAHRRQPDRRRRAGARTRRPRTLLGADLPLIDDGGHRRAPAGPSLGHRRLPRRGRRRRRSPTTRCPSRCTCWPRPRSTSRCSTVTRRCRRRGSASPTTTAASSSSRCSPSGPAGAPFHDLVAAAGVRSGRDARRRVPAQRRAARRRGHRLPRRRRAADQRAAPAGARHRATAARSSASPTSTRSGGRCSPGASCRCRGWPRWSGRAATHRLRARRSTASASGWTPTPAGAARGLRRRRVVPQRSTTRRPGGPVRSCPTGATAPGRCASVLDDHGS